MNFLRSLSQNLLLKAELSDSPVVQQLIVSNLYKAKSTARAWLKPYLNVYQWQGQTPAGGLTVLYAGPDGPNKFLKELLFGEQEPEQKALGQLGLGQLVALLETTPIDLAMVQADGTLINRLPRQNSIRLPRYVAWLMNVQGTPEELRLRIPKNMRKDVTRLMREHNYEYEVSHNQEDFDHFYRKMYLPSTKDLHGELAEPTPYAEAAEYFKHGWLYKITRQGEYICGRLAYVKHGVVYLKLIGLKDADLNLRRDGIHHATTYPLLLDLNERGFKFVNMGQTAPFSGLNLFQHKRRWGTILEPLPYEPFQYWFRFYQNTPAVAQFMQANPLVCLNEDDDLYGLLVLDKPESLDEESLKKQSHLYLVPGMKHLRLCSTADLVGAMIPEKEAGFAIDWVTDKTALNLV